MRITPSLLIVSFGVCLAASASATNVPRTNRMWRPTPPAVRGSARTIRDARRMRYTASCASDMHGGYAFDDSTAFMTNLSTAEYFGQSNLAAASESGTFEGFGNTVCDSESVIAGGQSNTIDGGNTGNQNVASTSFIGAGYFNTITSYDAAIAAGRYNEIDSDESFIGGGDGNGILGTESFIGNGFSNSITTYNSFIGSGTNNTISGGYSAMGSGTSNIVGATYAFIGSGKLNTISSAGNDSVLGGGYGNTMAGQKAVLGGGEANEVAGSFATVPGGYHDEAVGNESFAAGSQAEARYTGSFVWSDYVSGKKPVADSAAGEFVARASGGVYFFSNAGSSTGVHLAAGSGTWSSLSDRNAKTGIVPLDDASILAKVASLPISAWQYKSERGVRHVGPMAQDFYAAFGVGEDDRHITSIDEDGVALAAIKALSRQVGALRKENAALKALSTQIGDVRDERAELAALSRSRRVARAECRSRFTARCGVERREITVTSPLEPCRGHPVFVAQDPSTLEKSRLSILVTGEMWAKR